MKRIISITLVLAALLLMATPVHGAAPPEMQPQYTDAISVVSTLNISDSDIATVVVRVIGNQSLTNTSVKIYLERRGALVWLPPDINDFGQPTWEYSTTDRNFSQTFSMQLDRPGEYRAVCEFTFTGSVTEEVTKTAYATN